MVKKAFKHKEIEPCNICKKDIDTSKDEYAVMLDYEGKECYSIGFYHNFCLKDIILEKGKDMQDRVQSQIKGIMNWGENIVRRICGEEQVVNVN